MKRQNLSKFAATIDHHHHTWSSASQPNITPIKSYHSHLIKQISKCIPFRRKPKVVPEKKFGIQKRDLSSIELYPSPIELNVPSEILSTAQVHLLGAHLPPVACGGEWNLNFSTCLHGFSLKALYRKMIGLKSDLPVLLVIKDVQKHVIGVLASNPLRESESYYGLGSSFLFRFTSTMHVQTYRWTGDNFYFIKGDPDSISFGGGDGKIGLWLDGDLNHGRSESCVTFGNAPLISSGSKGGDFIIKALEVWTFGW